MTGVLGVMQRELRRLPRLPVLWALLGPIPVAAGVLLAGVFHAEVARRLPIGVLDFDGSETARLAVRGISAARSVDVVARVQDLGQARALLVARKVYAVLVIPRHFERDEMRGRSPRATLLYNEEYLTAGNLISADVSRVLNGGLRPEPPVRVDARLLFNPAVNYASGIGLTMVVGLIQIVAGLSVIYAVGRELRDSTAGEWLAAAGGSAIRAWAGKLAPYVLYNAALTLVAVGGFLAWFHVPIRGSLLLLGTGALAFTLASTGIGVLFTVWPANLGQALGLGSVFFGPAVAFSGVTFPRIAMPAFAKIWGAPLPITAFMLVIRDQVMVGASPGTSMAPILMLVATALVTTALALPRLGRVLHDPALWGKA